MIKRTLNLSVRIINMVTYLPKTSVSRMITNQILRSATSIGANYRAACRSKSLKDFVNKLKIAEEEADETLYWLEVIESVGLFRSGKIYPLKTELNELIAIFVSSIKTAKLNMLKKGKTEGNC